SELTDGTPHTEQPGNVDGMSSDGRFVFFHTGAQLTDDDTDGGISEYRYDADAPVGERLKNLAVRNGLTQADTLGVCDDGKTVYFNTPDQLVVWHEGQPGTKVVSAEIAQANSYGYASPNGMYFEYLRGDHVAFLYSVETGQSVCISCN